ncbi:MAG TPA: hypothetical protein VI488_04440 [Candidatus Angelobacter sp.]
MGNSKFACIMITAASLGLACAAQVLAVSDIKDPRGQLLQQKYITQLRELGADAAALHFPYAFYFSNNLDIDESRQKQLPQGSIRFDRMHDQVVLAITGNYYISYSTSQLTPNQRARKTFEDVVLPLLKVAVSHVDKTAPFDAYAFEIAHHVHAKMLKVDTEGPENLVVVVARGMAERLVQGKDIETRQGVLLESEVYLNGEPLTLWLSGNEAPLDVKDRYLARRKGEKAPDLEAAEFEPGSLVSPHLLPQSELLNSVRENGRTARDVSPGKLVRLELKYEDTTRKLVSDLNAQAHFVDYAPPAFIAFRDGAYLQLNLTTDLDQPAGSSQYRIAALAFDTHIAHLLRPVSRYFHDSAQFEGIDFSTTVHQAAPPTSEAVEFVVPMATLLCYEKYDCTGQELINRSVVLINGERVALDLQKAESDFNAGVR